MGRPRDWSCGRAIVASECHACTYASPRCLIGEGWLVSLCVCQAGHFARCIDVPSTACSQVEETAYVIVLSEEDNSTHLLSARIHMEDIYQRQQGDFPLHIIVRRPLCERRVVKVAMRHRHRMLVA